MKEIKNISLMYNQLNIFSRFIFIFVIKHELIHKRIYKLFMKESKPTIKLYYISKYDFLGECYCNYPKFTDKNSLFFFRLIFIDFIQLIWDLLCGLLFLNSIPYSFYGFLLDVYIDIKLILRKDD